MLGFPNAKINLGLSITERRPDNFHNIETLFYPIPLSDILEVLRTDGNSSSKVSMSITGMEIPGNPESNLCIKAYHLLDKEFNLPPVRIILHKIIPMGAGLGGGSADGAFTLTLLDQLFELGLSKDQLIALAGQLGSDCPFFIYNKPALGTEKGNVLMDYPLDLSGKYLALVKPPVFVGTAEAYAGVKPRKPEIPLSELLNLPITDWKNRVKNDFEESIFDRHPEIETVKKTLYSQGALYASMTGSGSAIFGIFDEEKDLKHLFPDMYFWGGCL